MSLLTGKHTVTVTPKVKTRDQYGDWALTPGVPVQVRCSVQPVGAEEAEALGVQASTTNRVIGRGIWPGGVHSTVLWGGRSWDQHGEVRQYSMSPRTAHYDLIITARSAEVK